MEIPNIVRNALYSKLSKRALRAQKLILSYLIKKYSFPLLDSEGTDLQELRSLRREIQALKKENEFLKKAATFFASNQN